MNVDRRNVLMGIIEHCQCRLAAVMRWDEPLNAAGMRTPFPSVMNCANDKAQNGFNGLDCFHKAYSDVLVKLPI